MPATPGRSTKTGDQNGPAGEQANGAGRRDSAADRHDSAASGRTPTITEQARRAQLVGVTIDLIATHGYARCSLQRIADAAGITKAAVIYHFASKNAVITAAYTEVITQLTDHITAAITAAPGPAAAVDAYAASMINHLIRNPTHVRVISEVLDPDHESGLDDGPGSASRWQNLMTLLDAARDAGEFRPDLDSKMFAIMLGGAVDAVVREATAEPGMDQRHAVDGVLGLIKRVCR